MGRILTALGLALVPACVAWWSGRRLLAHLDDAVFPERLLARRRQIGLTAAICGAAAAAVGRSPLLALSVEAAGLVAVSYPLRKAIYDEAWSFGAYLSWTARFALAFFAFWLVVLVAPLLLLRIPAPSARLAAGLAVGAGLVFWSRAFLPFVRWILRTTPLDRPDLGHAFEAVVSRSRVSGVGVDVIGPRGGIWPNALAVASKRKRHVFVGRTLLERLSAHEAVAIFSHEVAHLEQFTTAFLRRLRVIDGTLIVVGTLGLPAASATGIASEFLLDALWLLGAMTLLVVRSHGHQQREMESDRRAAELCGDPEALIRGLTKLHAIARIPRRWAEAFERSATHPSLASRIRALRASPAAGPALAAEVFSSRTGSDVLILDAARATWLKGASIGSTTDVLALQQSAASSQSVTYAALVDLHLAAGPLRPPRLVAHDADGRTYVFDVRSEDTARLQRTLDDVEGFVRARRSAAAPREVAIVCGVAAWVLALVTSAWAVSVLAVVTLARRTPATLLALATASLASGILALRSADVMFAPPGLILAGGMVVAIAAAWAASGHRDADGDWSRGSGVAAAAAGGAAALAWAVATYAWLAHPSTLWIHHAVQAMPGAIILPIAAATALMTRRDALSRNAGRLLAVLALVPLAIGSDAFLLAATRDPLLADAPALVWTSGDPAETARVPLARGVGYFDQIRLSPGARRFAVRNIADNDETPSEYLIGDFDGALRRTVHAFDVRWMDDRRLLLLRQRGASWDVELVDVARADGRPEASWSNLDVGWPERLEVRPDSWVVIGWTSRGGGRQRALRLRGRIGLGGIERTEWSLPAEVAAFSIIPGDGDNAIAVSSIYDVGSLPVAALLQFGGPYPIQPSSVYRLTPAGPQELFRSALSLRCVGESVSSGGDAWCLAVDGRRTFFWRMSVARGSITPEAQLDRLILREAEGPNGGIIVWGACAGAAAIWPSRLEARALGDAGRDWTDVAVAGRQLAAIEFDAGGQWVVRVNAP